MIQCNSRLISRLLLFAAIFLTAGLAYGYDSEEDSLIDQIQISSEPAELQDALNELGVFYGKTGRYEECARCFLELLEISERLNDSIRIYRNYLNLGNVFSLIGDTTEATDYYFQSLNYISGLNQEKKRAKVYYNLIGIGADWDYLNKALEIYHDLNDSVGISKCYMMKAEEYQSYEKPDSVIYFHKLSSSYATGSVPEYVYDLNLAGAYMYVKDYPTAVTYLKKGLSSDLVRPQDQVANYFSLSNCLAELGEYEEALSYEKLARTINDSLMTVQNEKKIYQLALGHQENEFMVRQDSLKQAIQIKNKQAENHKLLAERSRSIILFLSVLFVILSLSLVIILNLYKKSKSLSIQLNKTVEELEIKRYNMELRALQATMNPHFIANSLASVNYYISQNDAEASSNFLADLGKLMRIVFNDSMKKVVSIEREIETLNTYFSIERNRVDDNISFSVTLDEQLDPSEYGIPPLLIQPFVENAIWHGLREKEDGKINVDFKLERDHMQITIEDNGIGGVDFDKSSRKRFNSTFVSYNRLQKLCNEFDIDTPLELSNKIDESGEKSGVVVVMKIPVQLIEDE